MSTPSPEDLARAQDAAHLLNVFPVIKRELEAMARVVDNRMKGDLTAGRATAEGALEAWREKAAYERIISRLEQKIRAGGLDV